MAHTNPRVKRAYQPTLDTYLLRSTALSSHPTRTSTTHDVALNDPSTADEATQSTLLSVGMRVRKALAAGYQNAQKTSPQVSRVTWPLGDATGNTQFRSCTSNGLMPMCGINKVGGFGVQAFPSIYDQENESEWLNLSQESNVTNVSMDLDPKAPERIHTKGKRRYEEDAEDADCEDNSIFMPISHTEELARQTRPKAKAFARRRQSTRTHKNLDVTMADSTDFEDAPFLLPPSE